MMINASRFFCFCVTVALAGCALFETTTYSPDEAPARIVITPTPLFYGAPVNDRADEYLPTGTVVQLIRKSFGYSLVRKENGVTGYVPNEDLAETNRPFELFGHFDSDFLIPDLPANADFLVLPQDNVIPTVSPTPPKATPTPTPTPSKKPAKEKPAAPSQPAGITATTSEQTVDSQPSFMTKLSRSLTNLWPWSGGSSGKNSEKKST